MTVIQIFIIAIALYSVSRALVQFRRGSLTIAWLIFWILFWIAAGTVAVLPQTTDVVARFFGVGRGADFIIYLSLIVLFAFSFRMFVKLEHVEREITSLVRKLAIEEVEKPNKE